MREIENHRIKYKRIKKSRRMYVSLVPKTVWARGRAGYEGYIVIEFDVRTWTPSDDNSRYVKEFISDCLHGEIEIISIEKEKV